MKHFLKSHPEAILTVVALILAGVVLGYYIWGVGDVVTVSNSALKFTPTTDATQFNLNGARQLDLRGLTPQ